eukprot:3610790-Amphidinium_carterae.1
MQQSGVNWSVCPVGSKCFGEPAFRAVGAEPEHWLLIQKNLGGSGIQLVSGVWPRQNAAGLEVHATNVHFIMRCGDIHSRPRTHVQC